MKLFSCLVQIQEGGAIYKVDVVEYKDGLWFVPEWFVNPIEKWRRPTRIIRMDLLRHQKPFDQNSDLVVNEPISIDALYGRSQPPKDQRLEVIENPAIQFPLQSFH